ncbi:hypothetical protein [Methylobacterium sp. WL6]|uniref:hypothetical protein n=1 Tax=Methylobacterium sp. WL6 TaxID=2603901 RepID=UPI0011CB2744|nr:hypothetical protein [Methylobacterium sp. WL6]TXN63211.1 hypothetical protein FV230_20450 [Methylobacterium sp. WL6]
MPDDAYDPASLRVLDGLPRRRPGGVIAYEDGDPIAAVLAAADAGWPDLAGALGDVERALGGEPWTEGSLLDRIDAARLTCAAAIEWDRRGEPTGTPLGVEALTWLAGAVARVRSRVED